MVISSNNLDLLGYFGGVNMGCGVNMGYDMSWCFAYVGGGGRDSSLGHRWWLWLRKSGGAIGSSSGGVLTSLDMEDCRSQAPKAWLGYAKDMANLGPWL